MFSSSGKISDTNLGIGPLCFQLAREVKGYQAAERKGKFLIYKL